MLHAVALLDQRSASWISVSVVRPRKSILRSASFSRPFMSYCVTISSRLVLYSGTRSLQRLRRDHDAGGVHRAVARQAFEAQRDVEHFLDARVLLAQPPSKPGSCSIASFSVMLRTLGTSLVMRSTSAKRHVEHAADVFDRGARAQRAEGDDLRDLLAAVLLA